MASRKKPEKLDEGVETSSHVEHEDHESHAQHAHQEEGEPWLVSYADMMTLLFGFFVVMYSFAASNPKSEECVRLKLMDAFRTDKASSGDATDEAAQNAAMRALEMLVTMLNLESIEDVIQKIQEAEERSRDGEGDGSSSRDKKEKLASDDLKAIMGADEIKDTVIISIPVDVLFAQGSTTLKSSSSAKLREVGATIGKLKNIEDVRVVGHTDSSTNDVKSGLDSWALSVVRASEVAKFLTANTVSRKLVRVEGRGSAEPLLPERTPEGAKIPENMEKNRRIEIFVSKDRQNVK